MRPVRKAATEAARHSPSFTKIHDHELGVLLTMHCWALRLFVHLVQLTNYQTGAGRTTCTDLAKLMQPLQKQHGPKAFCPNARAVRDCLLRFEEAKIFARDKASSQKDRFIFFIVAPRSGQVRPSLRLGGVTRRGVHKHPRPLDDEVSLEEETHVVQ
jgi:hypothetical protein